MKSFEVFRCQHDKNTAIAVRYSEPDKGLCIILQRAGQTAQKTLFHNPADVTFWFQNSSKANVTGWQAAYHKSGLGAKDFERPNDIKLAVPYFTQRDNTRFPGRTCNVTSYAMVLSYLGARKKGKAYSQFEDELEKYLEDHGKDRHNHNDLVWLAGQYGVKARFTTNAKLADIDASLKKGLPVVVSGVFTSAGHIVCIVGLTHDGDYLVHDPYGDVLSSPKYSNHDGKYKTYPREYMMATVKNPGQDAKWAHFFERP